MKISTDLFVVPYNAEQYLLYAPLKQWALLVNQDSVNLLAALERGEIVNQDEAAMQFLTLLKDMEIVDSLPSLTVLPDVNSTGRFAPTSVTLFLTTDCNLRCAYCYASGGETSKTIEWPVAQAAVDEIIRNATITGTNHVGLGFHGGGEPTLPWTLFTRTVEYARDQAAQHGFALTANTASNGILSQSQLNWLIAHLSEVNISFDGIPQVQDRQRPTRNGQGSFDLVATTLDYLEAAHFPYGIRATITQQSVEHLADMVTMVAKRWPHCQSLHIEPVFNCGRCVTNGICPPDDAVFVQAYRQAWKLARASNIRLYYSGVRIETTTNAFCKAAGDSFCVTPDGSVTSCFEVSDVNDPRSEIFFYGGYAPDQQRFIFDDDKIAQLRTLTVNNRAYCADCFIKWHCAGDCAAKVLHRNGDYANAPGSPRCWVNQTLSKDQIIYSSSKVFGELLST